MDRHGFRNKHRENGQIVIECQCGEVFKDPFGSVVWEEFEEHLRAEVY